MAINIELSELKRIVSSSEDLNNNLSQQLNTIKQLLESICNNVQSSELTQANQNLMKTIENLVASLNKNLPEIVSFLNQQQASYEQVNTVTQAEISNLVNSINESII